MEGTVTRFECPYCGKPINVCTATYMSKAEGKIDQVRTATQRWSEDLEITQDEQTITITPKGYLGKDVWYQINEALKSFDAEWVSAGKESRWVIKAIE